MSMQKLLLSIMLLIAASVTCFAGSQNVTGVNNKGYDARGANTCDITNKNQGATCEIYYVDCGGGIQCSWVRWYCPQGFTCQLTWIWQQAQYKPLPSDRKEAVFFDTPASKRGGVFISVGCEI
jgi:hypothetical protein